LQGVLRGPSIASSLPVFLYTGAAALLFGAELNAVVESARVDQS
jgi:hypothetical protein